MKKFLSVLLCCSLLLTLLLAGCGDSSSTNDTSGTQQESSTEAGDDGADLSSMRSDALSEVRKEYKDTIDATTINKLVGRLKSSTDLDSVLESSVDEYKDAVRAVFDDVLPFVTEGSLIGPKAPATYEEACTYITEEFQSFTNGDTTALDAALATMQETYDSDSQTAFDTARRTLWDEYECTVETNTYFQDHA